MGASPFVRNVARIVTCLSLATLPVFAAVSFAAPPDPSANAPARQPLSDAERQQLKDLRSRLDSGQLSPEQFAAQVDQLLGDRFPGREAAAASAGPFAHRAEAIRRVFHRVAERLDLTAEQKSSAKESLLSAGRQARVLAIENMARARLILTPEQRSRFDELRSERFAKIRDNAPSADKKPSRAERRERAQAVGGKLADELKLTPEQRDQIKAVREGAREQFRSLWDSTRAHLKSLLTPDQQRKLDQWREHRKDGGGKADKVKHGAAT